MMVRFHDSGRGPGRERAAIVQVRKDARSADATGVSPVNGRFPVTIS